MVFVIRFFIEGDSTKKNVIRRRHNPYTTKMDVVRIENLPWCPN